MRSDNRTVVDLSKVQYAKFYYRNQWGNTVQIKPKFSVHGKVRDPNEKMFNSETVTLKEYADAHDLTDIWEPCCRVQLTANHSLVYTGDKAKSIYKTFCERVFKPRKK